ncbi:hypothetical protein E2C01_078321 [Portunus trituberculatus]|uniref:Uncharacterized protein n=1 Tax=Portunus trituberculatus TaxID=210409 RepID=A0A5B7ISF4_PORTR|nr:hypothetical protein [Portunus trituberculatus]
MCLTQDSETNNQRRPLSPLLISQTPTGACLRHCLTLPLPSSSSSSSPAPPPPPRSPSLPCPLAV